MNEEEKEAIEFLKHSIFEYEEIDTSVMEYIDKNHKIIYKLILKQQKEIEKLNLENIELKQRKIIDKNSIPDQDNFYDCYNFISKDKIREKLRKSKKEYEYYEEEDLENLMRMTSGEIVILEELLGETND